MGSSNNVFTADGGGGRSRTVNEKGQPYHGNIVEEVILLYLYLHIQSAIFFSVRQCTALRTKSAYRENPVQLNTDKVIVINSVWMARWFLLFIFEMSAVRVILKHE